MIMRWMGVFIGTLSYASLLHAHNCGSLDDCFGTIQAATGVGVGIAVMMVVGWLVNLFHKANDHRDKEEENSGTAESEGHGEPSLQPGDRNPVMRAGEAWRGNDVRTMIRQYGEHIDAVSKEFGVDADLIRGIIFEEQTHLWYPVEDIGERLGVGSTIGLGQVTEDLHGFTREQLFDPIINIRAIGTHLTSLQAQPLIDPKAPIASLASRYNCGTCTSVTPYGRRVAHYHLQFGKGKQ